MAKVREEASKMPLIASVLGLLLSTVLVWLSYFMSEHSNWQLSFTGWLITPVLTFSMLGVDFYLQNKPNLPITYESKPQFTRWLKVFAYLSVVLALIHIYRFALVWSVIG
jgi:hypothetical protein